MRSSQLPWHDTTQTYGRISRLFHWLMALFLAWQFTSVLLRVLARDSALYGVFWPTHSQVGFTILVLAVLRGAWGLYNAGRRPSHGAGPLARWATIGHLALYALMIIIPTLALMRAYGGGRGFAFQGLQVLPATGERVDALMAPASAVHGPLGWLLLALIVGHVAMAVYHTLVLKDETLQRMAPRL